MARVHDDANASQPVVVISGKVLTLCDQLSWTHNQLFVLCHVKVAIIGTTGKTVVIPNYILQKMNEVGAKKLSWTHNQLLVLCHVRTTVKGMTGKTSVIPYTMGFVSMSNPH